MPVQHPALSRPYLHDEKAAYAFVEAQLWADGRPCPHCGTMDESVALQGKSTRLGVYKCRACRKPFTVKVGTIFESSHIKLHIWLQAIFLLSSSKKGISSNQLARSLDITLKSAWFLSHRIREAMREGALEPMGGSGEIVEADETYYGPVREPRTRTKQGKPYKKTMGGMGPANKRIIVSLVERGGAVRSFHVPFVTKDSVTRIVRENLDKETRLFTDEAHHYHSVGKELAQHATVNHSRKEYVRGEVSTNVIEGFFGIFKRGMRGVYQHCSEKHLHRYLSEYDFRYNHRIALGVDDEARARQALKGVVGKRLTYQTTNRANASKEITS